jgi:hypothetical protein
MTRYIVGTLFFGAFMSFGLFAITRTVSNIPNALQSPGWPVAAGVITESRLTAPRKKGARHQLRYAYDVDGVAYSSDRTAFAGVLWSATARDRAARFPEGKTVSVYYQPGNPSVAVLEPGVSWFRTVGALLVGLLFTALGGAGFKALFFGRDDSQGQAT